MLSLMLIFAYCKAFIISGIMCSVWCSAVYLGKKPVPEGVIKVFLGFDRIFPWQSTIPLIIIELTYSYFISAAFYTHNKFAF